MTTVGKDDRLIESVRPGGRHRARVVGDTNDADLLAWLRTLRAAGDGPIPDALVTVEQAQDAIRQGLQAHRSKGDPIMSYPRLVLADRPRPIKEAFGSVGSTVVLIGSVVTALVGWGVLSAAQGDAVGGLLGLIPGLITGVTGLLQAFQVTKVAEPQVTPISDPATVDPATGELVPLVPAAA